jgi:hypothetical protein
VALPVSATKPEVAKLSISGHFLFLGNQRYTHYVRSTHPYAVTAAGTPRSKGRNPSGGISIFSGRRLVSHFAGDRSSLSDSYWACNDAQIGTRNAFNDLRDQHRLGDKHFRKEVVSRLLKVMDNLEAVEAWRGTLTEKQRLSGPRRIQELPGLQQAQGGDGRSKAVAMRQASASQCRADPRRDATGYFRFVNAERDQRLDGIGGVDHLADAGANAKNGTTSSQARGPRSGSPVVARRQALRALEPVPARVRPADNLGAAASLERRAALELWAAHVKGLVAGKPTRVVSMRHGAKVTGPRHMRRSGGAPVAATSDEHGRATPETPRVQVQALTVEEKGAA